MSGKLIEEQSQFIFRKNRFARQKNIRDWIRARNENDFIAESGPKSFSKQKRSHQFVIFCAYVHVRNKKQTKKGKKKKDERKGKKEKLEITSAYWELQ